MGETMPRARGEEEEQGRRHRILEAAREEILEVGFFGASVDQIARRAGVSKQSIYSLFDSKQALFRAVLVLTGEQSRLEGLPDTRGLPLGETLQLACEWVRETAAKPANLELYRANVAAASTSPALAEDLHRLRTSSPDLPALIRARMAEAGLPDCGVERLANWFGVLAIGGPSQLLGSTLDGPMRENWTAETVHLFAKGWRIAPPQVEDFTASPPLPRRDAAKSRQGGRVSLARWEGLLRVAIDLFTTAGLRRTSVDDVSAATGVAKMTIYRRYGSKEALFTAAVAQAVDDLLAERPTMVFSDDIAQSLSAIALDYDRFAQQDRHVGLMRLLVTEAPGHADVALEARERLWRPGIDELATQLAVWREEGRVHPISPAIAAEQFLILATRGNVRLTGDIEWSEPQAAEQAGDLVRLFLRPPA